MLPVLDWIESWMTDPASSGLSFINYNGFWIESKIMKISRKEQKKERPMLASIVRKISITLSLLGCLWILLGTGPSASGAGAADDKGTGSESAPTPNIEKKWGISILPIRLTAEDKMIDFRFRVIDPDKAMALMHRGDQAYLLDQASGRKMPVPRTKVGPMRQTGSPPKKGAVYPVLFINLGRTVKPESRVTVVFGDFRVENLIVKAATPYRKDLPEAKQAEWDAVQKSLNRELRTCTEDCGQNRACFDKCEKAHQSRLEREYRKLLDEK